MSEQISKFTDKNLSPYLSGFREGYNTQQCLLLMIEKWKKALDNKKHAGAILTDLSKAFDSGNQTKEKVGFKKSKNPDEKTIAIIGDSLVKDVDPFQLRKKLKNKDNKVYIHNFIYAKKH